jgi:hypothetical protein
MPDCLPGLKPEDNTGSTKPSTSARPSSAVPQSLSDDATQVMKILWYYSLYDICNSTALNSRINFKDFALILDILMFKYFSLTGIGQTGPPVFH